MMKKRNLGKGFIGASILCCTFSSAIPTAFALENVVKIGAVIEVLGIHYDNNGKSEQQKLSTHQKKYGLYSSGNILVDYALESDSGLKYGANTNCNN